MQTNQTNIASRYARIFVFSVLGIAMFLVGTLRANAESPNILSGPDLTIGSTGQGVVVLQGILSELGYLNIPSGIPKGYYGSLTKNAVAGYQAAMGVSPAVGYFGPVTKIAMHEQFLSRGWLGLLGW